MKRLCYLFAMITGLTGCSGVKVEDYADKTPEFDIREYFNGPVEASGVFINRAGKMDSFFHVHMHGKWNGNEGTLEEKFVYDDGKTGERVWKLSMSDDHHFTGTAHDIIGISQGTQFGNAVNMQYVLRQPVGDTTYDLSMDDWLYRIDEHTVINRIVMTKLGIKVGELVLSFKKK